MAGVGLIIYNLVESLLVNFSSRSLREGHLKTVSWHINSQYLVHTASFSDTLIGSVRCPSPEVYSQAQDYHSGQADKNLLTIILCSNCYLVRFAHLDALLITVSVFVISILWLQVNAAIGLAVGQGATDAGSV